MGYTGKLKEKKQAIMLRKKGLSYKEIKKKVNVSKSTLNKWCRDVILSVEQFERLRKKKLEGAALGRMISAKKQQRARIKRTKKLLKIGKKEVGNLKKRNTNMEFSRLDFIMLINSVK
jgi:transposase